jgi:hypothetical protein
MSKEQDQHIYRFFKRIPIFASHCSRKYNRNEQYLGQKHSLKFLRDDYLVCLLEESVANGFSRDKFTRALRTFSVGFKTSKAATRNTLLIDMFHSSDNVYIPQT